MTSAKSFTPLRSRIGWRQLAFAVLASAALHVSAAETSAQSAGEFLKQRQCVS